MLETVKEYHNFVCYELPKCSSQEKIAITRRLCRTDLFFLIWYGFGRRDMEHEWLLARCKEVESNPNGYLDLWSREHYKSTIITYGKTIQDVLASHGDDPLTIWQGKEPTFGIFSHTRPIAKGFLRQIKREFESNALLLRLFPDIIWENCHKEAPKWSEDDGLVLKRKSNPKESTIEAWGLVEGQPTSKHFTVRIYDDVVTKESVNTPEMIQKTLEAWEMSLNLGSGDGIERYIGTRYHFNDTYREIIARGAAIPRIHPATKDGTVNGEPVFWTKELLAEKRRRMGAFTFSTQMLQNPIADEKQSFKREWLQWHKGATGDGTNKYIIVDPASEKKKTSDYTAMAVIGLGADENYYVLDLIRDRLNLLERGDCLFHLHRKWKPLTVGYERYGMQSDVEHLKDRMRREHYHFHITELSGKVSKLDRIKWMIPTLSNGRWYFPDSIFKTNYEGRVIDLIDTFINEEYLAFPVSVHDDMLDCMSRIHDPDLKITWPRLQHAEKQKDRYTNRRRQSGGSAWVA
jgi:phage terminase large subunit-like protein